MAKVTKKTKMEFTVRATDTPENMLLGAVRMRGREGLVNWVYGITSMFIANKGEGIIYFEKDAPFFYGSRDDYYKNALKIKEKLESFPLPGKANRFVDKYYAGETLDTYRRFPGERIEGFLKIPVVEMPFAEKQRDLIARIVEEAEHRLPDLIQNLVQMPIDLERRKWRVNLNNALGYFPKEIQEETLRKGYYFSSKETTVERPTPIFISKPKVWSTPTGGLPDWAREYWRRHPR